MAVYCNECGTGNPDGSEFCTRCGAAITPTPALLGDLVLPEWLTRAAAESADPVPVSPRVHAVENKNHPPAPAPIPTGDLTSAIPNWLKGPVQQVASTQPEESLLTDPTDTRGFISEDDLPAWIRQIAIADAARKAEAERKAAATKTVESEPVVEAPASPKRRLLPGEIEAVRASTNPWLARGERAPIEDAAAPGEPAQADSISAPRAIESAPTESDSTTKSRTMPSFGGANLRYLLIGAIVVLVAILILALAL